MLGGRERQKSQVVDKQNRSLGREKMYFTRSLWACIKVPLTHSCKIFSARPSIALHHSRPITRLNSKHRLSTSLSIRSRPKRINQKYSSRTSFHHSLFLTYRESRCKSNCNSRRRSSSKLRRRLSRKLLPILDRNWTANRLWIWINERDKFSNETLTIQVIIHVVRINRHNHTLNFLVNCS